MLRDLLSDLQYRLRALFLRRRMEGELDEELRSHYDHQVEVNLSKGMSPTEARRQARLTFGGLDQLKEECREARGTGFVDELMQDLRSAGRQLVRSPGFTTVAVLSLALGIGANTAIFSLADAVLLRKLPVDRPDELEQFRLADTASGRTSTFFNYPTYREFRDHAKAFSAVIARRAAAASFFTGGRPEPGVVEAVSGNYFTSLGIKPHLGRLLDEGDDRTPMGRPVAVLSFRSWRQRMGADPGVIGRTIRIDQHSFTVIGVTEPGFFGVEVGTSPDAWIPITQGEPYAGASDSRSSLFESIGVQWINILGRRAPGVTQAQAQAALNVAYQNSLDQLNPRTRRMFENTQIVCHAGGQGFSRLETRFHDPLLVLIGLVALVLAIACANVAGLLLARHAARRSEMGIRLALGAGRWRLAGQLLVESVPLGVLGGAFGILLSRWGVQLLLGFLPPDVLPLAIEAPVDFRLLAFAAGISLLTTLLVGLIPAIGSSRVNLVGSWKDESAFGGFRSFPVRKLLVGVQIALSVALVTGGGLFLETLRNTAAIDIGMNTDNVLTARIDPDAIGYSDERTDTFFRELEARISGLPGVQAVGFTGRTMLSGTFYQAGNDSGSVPKPGERTIPVEVGGDLFGAAGIQIVRGRAFTSQDTAGGRRVAIINETAARYHFPGEDPIGQPAPMLRNAGEIVGIARDSKMFDIHEVQSSLIYRPVAQNDGYTNAQTIYIRTSGDAPAFAPILRREVEAIDANVPVSGVKTFATQKNQAMARERLVAALSGFFAVLALVLAAVGIYGVVAYSVVSRTREIGVRVSLGARRRDVIWIVLRTTLALVLGGIVVGLPLCLWLSQFLRSQLYGVEPNDPATMATTAGILTLTALLAATLPARKAVRVDPVRALRHD